MASLNEIFLDFTGLSAYDALVKAWANSDSQIAYKTVAKSADGNSILFFKKPNAVVGTDTADASIDLGSSDIAAKLDELANIAGATWNATTKKYELNLDSTFDGDTETIVDALNELKSQINTLNGADTVTGSVANTVKNAIEGLDTAADVVVASKSGKAITISGSVKEQDGIIAKGNEADVTLADVASTGKAEDVTIEDAGNKLDATNVEDAIEELADAISDALDDSVITAEENTGSGDVLKSYSFYQGVKADDDDAAKAAKKIIDINIPKDYVVKSASVKTVTEADKPYSGAKVGDKYISLVINTHDGVGTGTETELAIPLSDLVDAVKGSEGAEVTVAVASDNTISATINKIDASKIVYLAQGEGGAEAETTVKQALNTLNGADTVEGSVANAKKTAIDTVVGTNADTASANTVNGAKKYADGLVADLDTASDVAIVTANPDAGTVTITGSIKEEDGIIAPGTADTVVFSAITTAQINSLFA